MRAMMMHSSNEGKEEQQEGAKKKAGLTNLFFLRAFSAHVLLDRVRLGRVAPARRSRKEGRSSSSSRAGGSSARRLISLEGPRQRGKHEPTCPREGASTAAVAALPLLSQLHAMRSGLLRCLLRNDFQQKKKQGRGRKTQLQSEQDTAMHARTERLCENEANAHRFFW